MIKNYILCCFVDFRKSFDIMPKTNFWNRLEELKGKSKEFSCINEHEKDQILSLELPNVMSKGFEHDPWIVGTFTPLKCSSTR